MHEGSQYLDVILFAMVAVFLALRLRSVLGRRTGNEKPPPSMGPANPRTRGRVIDVTPLAHPAQPGARDTSGWGMPAITKADPSITSEGFLSGAKAAFQMILQAFWHGDEASLRGLLADGVFESFSQAIRSRQAAGEVCENALEEVESAEIAEASLDNMTAQITVKFVSRQLVATRDRAGTVVDGDPTHPVEHTDLWTFSRDLRSRDPNWVLTATRTHEE